VAVTRDGLEAFAFSTRRIDKPWGYELVWAQSEHYCGKLLFIRKGEQLSLQYHERKDETVYVHQGRIEIELGEDAEPQVVEAGAAFHIPPGAVHRWRALEDSIVLEASTPELDDVVRLKDRYGRAGT
jgi:quercetin dioxygenase-like cupin family protein